MANELDALLELRWQLKRERRYGEADELRGAILERYPGIEIEDYAWGTVAFHVDGTGGATGRQMWGIEYQE